MKISILAKKTNLTTRALRYYESVGLLKPKRTDSGYREYDENAVASVRHIRWLLDAGLTTKTIKQILPCIVHPNPKVATCERTRSILKREYSRLEGIVKQTKKSQRLLKKALGPN